MAEEGATGATGPAAGATGATGATGAPAGATGATGPASDADRGYPENTPVAEMTSAQQAAYWQHQARKHEGRNKALGGITPEKLAELQEKAKRADDLDYELSSDNEKKVADAARDAQETVLADVLPKLVRAEFKAAAAGRIDPETLTTLLEPLDLSKFLDDNGEVDTAKVATYVDGIAPATGTQPQRRGPGTSGAGRRDQQAAGTSVQSGRELYREKHQRRPAAAATKS